VEAAFRSKPAAQERYFLPGASHRESISYGKARNGKAFDNFMTNNEEEYG
jgi:hypothetical protein